CANGLPKSWRPKRGTTVLDEPGRTDRASAAARPGSFKPEGSDPGDSPALDRRSESSMISIDRVGKKFNDRWIFRNISLNVAPQESVVLLGPSGGGKSVLLRIIAGLLETDEG